jgi:hypothetical protein
MAYSSSLHFYCTKKLPLHLFAEMKAITVIIFLRSSFRFPNFIRINATKFVTKFLSFNYNRNYFNSSLFFRTRFTVPWTCMNIAIRHQITIVSGHAIFQVVRHWHRLWFSHMRFALGKWHCNRPFSQFIPFPALITTPPLLHVHLSSCYSSVHATLSHLGLYHI